MEKNNKIHTYMQNNKKTYQLVLIDMLDLGLVYSFMIIVLKFSHMQDFSATKAFTVLPFVVILKLAFYGFLRFYQMVLEHIGLDEIFRITVGVLITNLVIAIICWIVPDQQFIPEVYLFFSSLLEILALIVPRMIKSFIHFFYEMRKKPDGKRTLLVGAGAGGKLVLNEIRDNHSLNNQVIAFVDDDPEKIGKLMSGYKIFGPISKIPQFIDLMKIEEVIITVADITKERFQEIIEIISEKPVKIKRIPKFKDLNKDAPRKLQEVNVEDLLSRDVVSLDDLGICEFIKGKRVLVTGAGGSIGSELVRQIIKYNPSEILLFDIYENGIYDLQMELNRYFQSIPESSIKRRVLIGSVYNFERIKSVFENFKPQLVFHAAAYKHVPLMEDSAVEAVRTNCIGTYNVSKLASEYHVEKMVLVSSDKAVRPTNVMGATKRFAEMIITHFNDISETNYSAVRFGNVLGSNGSVVPLFKKQIEAGGPVTVTDKEIIRYFMTIPEAVGLILQSSTFAKGGEIFILDMGEPVKIYDLAEKMIMLTGLRPHKDIEIKITGLRPGEKLYEELLVDKETQNIKTENKKIFIENEKVDVDVDKEIQYIITHFEKFNNDEIKVMVKDIVPTYTIKK